jgi:hypothetical protein
MNTFNNAQTGDRVWSIRHGWGTVTYLSDHKIFVKFKDLNWDCVFTICGKYDDEDLYPTLFWDEVKIDIPLKPIKMKRVNGIEILDITFKPTLNERFYHPSIECMSLHKLMVYNDDEWCKFLSENDLCYPYNKMGQDAAILHAKALLGVKE